MTPFAALASLAGLSLREASDFHGTPIDTIKGWSNGRRRCPTGVINELKALITRQETAAKHILTFIQSKAGAGDKTEMGFPADDLDAQALGFPCVGAWRAMAARVIAGSPIDIALVPRGSTTATAGAFEARDKRDD